MDIEGLGREVIEALVSGGYVHSPVDLYRTQPGRAGDHAAGQRPVVRAHAFR